MTKITITLIICSVAFAWGMTALKTWQYVEITRIMFEHGNGDCEMFNEKTIVCE